MGENYNDNYGNNQPVNNDPQGNGYNQPVNNVPQGNGYNQPVNNAPQGNGYNQPVNNVPQGNGYNQPVNNDPQGNAYNQGMNNTFTNNNQAFPGNQLPMKWFKFVIYFQLFFAAFINLCLGVTYITGSIWDENGVKSELVYALFPNLKTIDTVYGVALFLLIPACIVVRFLLSGFKKNAPYYYFGLYGIQLLISWIYYIAIVVGTKAEVKWGVVLGTTIGVAVYVALNYVYFNKRKHLFVN